DVDAAAHGLLWAGTVKDLDALLESSDVVASAEGAEHAAALLRDALDALGHRPDRPLAVTAVLDGSPVGAAMAAALDEKALGGRALVGKPERVPAGAGALEPVARVAAALAAPDGHPHAVVTAAAEGNAAVCLITPGDANAMPGAPAGTDAGATPDAPAEADAGAGSEQPMSGRRRASDR
ncbi:hypothetical protein ACWDWU_48610, partial [Streptomyces sp. NPDC003442]